MSQTAPRVRGWLGAGLCGPLTNRLVLSGGDYHLFVDDDASQTAYVIYSASHWMAIERLTPDYLSSTGATTGVFPVYFVEAPVMFKRSGIYYAVFGHCCCYCLQGSGGLVWTAAHPLGPWSLQGGGVTQADFICQPVSTSNSAVLVLEASFPPTPTPGQGCLYGGIKKTSVARAQASYVVSVAVNTPEGSATQLVWAGDRWGQSPDGLKGHEPQFWAPIAFGNDGRVLRECSDGDWSGLCRQHTLLPPALLP